MEKFSFKSEKTHIYYIYNKRKIFKIQRYNCNKPRSNITVMLQNAKTLVFSKSLC